MKNVHGFPRRQRGAILIMGIIFLLLLMLSVTVAFRMSNNNLKAVGNVQAQQEAEASAQAEIEKLISSVSSFLNPVPTTVPTDSHGVAVNLAKPVCTGAEIVDVSSSADQNSGIHIEGTSLSPSGYLTTFWDVVATALGATGAKAEIHQGVRIILPEDPNPCP